MNPLVVLLILVFLLGIPSGVYLGGRGPLEVVLIVLLLVLVLGGGGWGLGWWPRRPPPA